MTIHEILSRYWGYEKFRPLQEEIIQSVLNGKDTLALMPTGGGKSICFQVPALAKEGLCIVVSPLIALMKDQVMQLKKRNIPAVAIYSGMSLREIDVALDNCVYGKIKLLYVSPERLMNDMFRERIQKMKVNLLAIDEAHCISQWGYDFRPPYLKIAEIRDLIPDVPVLAVTATATGVVCDDIMEKLSFREKNLLRKSFERKNLSYSVLFEEDKQSRLIKMLNKVPGTAIIYVRNRRKTKEIAEFLRHNNITAAEYHAGLDNATRSDRQDKWIGNKIRVIVCTNAFGMGIDKPDVRLVIHINIPENLESYFQEAGRAGRDEKKSFAVLLYNNSDLIELDSRVENSFPEIVEVKHVYHALGNYFQLAEGAGAGASFDFDIALFSKTYQIHPVKVNHALKLLEQQGYISVSESVFLSSRLMLTVDKETLYKFEIANPAYESILKTLLRSYGGIFDFYVPVREDELARNLKITREGVIKMLQHLQKSELLDYEMQKDAPQLTFLQPRLDKERLLFDKASIEVRKKTIEERLLSIKNYTTDYLKCRSRQLLNYFGETDAVRCGICDVCLKRHSLNITDIEFDHVTELIRGMLKQSPMTLKEVVDKTKGVQEDKTLQTIRWLIENDLLHENEKHELVWN